MHVLMMCKTRFTPAIFSAAIKSTVTQLANFAIKREQSQACLNYAEREQNRRSQERLATSETELFPDNNSLSCYIN